MERKDKEQMIEDILDAAIQCRYQAKTVEEIQITQIAARAGISTRTLHRYFSDKAELLACASNKFLKQKYFDILEGYLSSADPKKNGMERLLDFIAVRKNAYIEDPVYAAMFVEANINCIRAVTKSGVNQFDLGNEMRNIVILNVELGMKDGSMRKDLDLSATTLLLSASLNGVIQRMTFLFRTDTSDETKRQVAVVFDEYINMVRMYLSA